MKYVFTDCFDTLIIRKEHPYQIVKRWAKCVNRLYSQIDADELFSLRMKLIRQYPVAQIGIRIVYKELYSNFKTFIENEELFYKDLHMLELLCEESTSSVNDRVSSFLKANKEKGCKVYCITDYHLYSKDIAEFVKHLGIDYIDGFFSSASWRQTKHEGGLYQVVLDSLGANPSECLMIGDNRVADIYNAKKQGLSTKFFPKTIHKSIIRLKNKLGLENNTIQKIGKDLWKHTSTYMEYSLVFYTFCVRLFEEARNKGIKKIVFLAREGLFLKHCFEAYQAISVPRNSRLTTAYLKCSRRAIHSVQREKCLPSFFKTISVSNYFISIGFTEEQGQNMAKQACISDPYKVIDDFANSPEAKIIWKMFGKIIEERIIDNRNAFDEYVHGFSDNGKTILVDVGWIGRMQQGIDALFDDLSTTGYYIGIYQNLFEAPYVERHGLVFNKDETGKESAWFNIFRSNIQLYEQLLSAGHGSACFYRFKDEKPYVHEKWECEEEQLFREVISDIQGHLLSVFMQICTYHFNGIAEGCMVNNRFNKELLLVMLRSSLLQSKSRLVFMERLIQGFSQNFQQQTTGMHFSATKIDAKNTDIIIHPDRFVRYIAKVGYVAHKKGLATLGRFFMRVFYGYTRIITYLK